jgi:hypothetical protein
MTSCDRGPMNFKLKFTTHSKYLIFPILIQENKADFPDSFEKHIVEYLIFYSFILRKPIPGYVKIAFKHTL